MMSYENFRRNYPYSSYEDYCSILIAQRQAWLYATQAGLNVSSAPYALPHKVPLTVRQARFVLDGGLPDWWSNMEGYSEDGDLDGLLDHFGY